MGLAVGAVLNLAILTAGRPMGIGCETEADFSTNFYQSKMAITIASPPQLIVAQQAGLQGETERLCLTAEQRHAM